MVHLLTSALTLIWTSQTMSLLAELLELLIPVLEMTASEAALLGF